MYKNVCKEYYYLILAHGSEANGQPSITLFKVFFFNVFVFPSTLILSFKSKVISVWHIQACVELIMHFHHFIILSNEGRCDVSHGM